MEIKSNKIDELNISLSMDIAEADYAAELKKKLAAHRRNADIRGFRKGMAPASLINKLYGVPSRSEAVNDLISKGLQEYIEKNELNIIGEPLPAENQANVDWEKDVDFHFDFDIALAPKIDLEISKDDAVVYYTIEADDNAKAQMRENLLRQYGTLQSVEEIAQDDFFTANFEQGDFKVENTYVALRNVSAAAREALIGKHKGDVMDINVNEWFENETDRAAMLKLEKDELAAMSADFKMTINDIKRFVAAQANQQTYDKIFGEGVVKTDEQFEAKIVERLMEEYDQERDFRFMLDVKEYLLEKAAIALPEAFLKRWIYYANDGKFSMEDIDKEFALFLKDFRWQMIRGYFMKKFDIKVEQADMLNAAKKFASYQFAMYGITNAPDDQLEGFAMQMLQKEDQSRRIYEKVEDDLTIAAIKERITLKEEVISIEKLRELNG